MRLTRRTLLASVGAAGIVACSPAAVKPAGPKTISSETDATELAAMIKRGDITAAEAVEAAIKRAEAIQPQINFMVTDTFAAARERAKTQLAGPFAGVPYLIKDLNSVKGVVTRMGSRTTANQPPAEKDSDITATMLAQGFVSIGKSSTPEHGYLPTTEPLAFGPTRNPWNIAHSSGGSSGGSAAAAAAGVVPIAHANDGGGSIRFPAANCGLVGLKPSDGRMNDGDPNPDPLNLGVQGCVSRTVRDTAAFFAACEMQTGGRFPAVGLVTAPGTKRLKVGLITKGFAGNEAQTEVAAIVRATAKLIEGMGHTIIETAWPTTATFQDDFLAYWSAGAAYDMQQAEKMLGKKVDETVVEPFSLRMAQNAAKLKDADMGAVQKRLMEAAAAYNAWIAGFDIVLSPVFSSPPSPLGYLAGDVPFDTLRERLLQEVGYTLIHNVAGAPAISLPLGWTSNGLPVGVQACAAVGQERVLLETAFELEAAQPWISKKPPVWAV
jgi:amidase